MTALAAGNVEWEQCGSLGAWNQCLVANCSREDVLPSTWGFALTCTVSFHAYLCPSNANNPSLWCVLLADADKCTLAILPLHIYSCLFRRKICRAGLRSGVRFIRGCFFIFTHLLERLSEGFQIRFLNPKAIADGKVGLSWALDWSPTGPLVAFGCGCGPPGLGGCLCDHSHLHSLRPWFAAGGHREVGYGGLPLSLILLSPDTPRPGGGFALATFASSQLLGLSGRPLGADFPPTITIDCFFGNKIMFS